MEKYLLGIDNGGSEIKCALFSVSGKLIAASSSALKIDTPEPGFTQRDGEEVWQANISVIKDVLNRAMIDPSDILAIGITAYGNGLVFTDEKIEPVYPVIVSTDNRAVAICERFKQNGVERKLYPLTRQTIWSAQPCALLPWFREYDPKVLDETRWIISLKDFIRFRLTGRLATELTEASSTGLMNLESRSYDPYIFETLGIADCLSKFPAVIGSTDNAGYITKKAAELTGLKEGTPVAAGYFDIDANALASGILDDTELCLIAGTWSINEFLTPSVSDDYDKRTNIATLSYMDDLYLMEDSSPTSSSNFNWYIAKIIKEYAPELDNEAIYSLCNSSVAERGPQESDVIFVPYLFASATHPDARGAFLNVTASDDHVSLLRAIYEGVVFSTVHHVRNLKRPITSFVSAKLSGGITNSPVWPQMMADALQMPIQTIEGSQIGAKGAAIGAGVACGAFADLKDGAAKMVKSGKLYLPQPGYAEIYARKYERYECALEMLDTLAERMKEI